MTNKARIALAGAMGYEFVPGTSSKQGDFGQLPATPSFWKCPGKADIYGPYDEDNPPFHPWKNANDDYAVLEWMRANHGSNRLGLALSRLHGPYDNSGADLAKNYEVGNYARAACAVLEIPIDE